jgi:2-oxoisovalerate dehydrogenase E2 component (dihydrolipoyl transacylase)
VEEFSPLCEVQSDKASVEITSRFAGVVKKLYYETGDMAKVGKPFVDIDILGDIKKEDLEALTQTDPEAQPQGSAPAEGASTTMEGLKDAVEQDKQSGALPLTKEVPTTIAHATNPRASEPSGNHAALATPAVRHLCKEHNITITDVRGTGKDGRVLKEDIYNFLKANNTTTTQPSQPVTGAPSTQVETPVPLTNNQAQMFKSMTKSLSIPHFVFSDELDFTRLVSLRQRLNKHLSSAAKNSGTDTVKLSYLPFIIKAVSQMLNQFPLLNSRVVLSEGPNSKPSLMSRSMHNVGVAMDTPSGLLVPVVKDVASRSVNSIATELARLQTAASQGKLSVSDLTGGTITVSNIGNVGGTYLSPVIVEREVAILGIGRLKAVPAFDEEDQIIKKQVCNFSWSADHRVVDGATMARAAEVVRKFVEEPDAMVLHMR